MGLIGIAIVGGNPVNFFDPSGCKGYFAETMDEKNNWTNEEKQEVIADFQMLTDYKIIYDGNFIDYEIPENFCSEDAKHPMGNMLIETTLGDSIDLGIKKSNSKFYYHPEDNTIDYVPNAGTQVWVEENFYTESMDGRMIKRGVLGEHPTYMRLGHELIHDFRRIKHVMFATGDLACGAYGYYRGMTYHYERIGINKEEYYTVGLDEHYNMRMSENALRKELGLPKRISY